MLSIADMQNLIAKNPIFRHVGRADPSAHIGEELGILWIDSYVFTNDEGTGYLYWGISNPKVARLKENMTELTEDPEDVVCDSDYFFEASYMHKCNGKYYFSYSAKKEGVVPLMIARMNPLIIINSLIWSKNKIIT